MKLTSPAFKNGGKIPQKYTCQGEDTSPPLEIQEVPQGTKTLALLMDDPDVPLSLRPDGMWVHLVVYNIDSNIRVVEENARIGTYGFNTDGRRKYMGPCPPDREHRYFFKLFALDTALGAISTKEELLKAMEGHILAQAELMGTYVKLPTY